MAIEYRRSELIHDDTGLRVPSGIEVESASLHIPVGDEPEIMPVHEPPWKEKLATVRSHGRETLHDMTRAVTRRVDELKPKVTGGISSLRSGVTSRVQSMRSSLDTSLRTRPAMWAGIAAGAGMGVGILGRVWRHRMSQRFPAVVIIDAIC